MYDKLTRLARAPLYSDGDPCRRLGGGREPNGLSHGDAAWRATETRYPVECVLRGGARAVDMRVRVGKQVPDRSLQSRMARLLCGAR